MTIFYQLKEKYDKKIFVLNDFSLLLVSIFVKPTIEIAYPKTNIP
jgi:hypothetical protein